MKYAVGFQIICLLLFSKHQLETEAIMSAKQLQATTKLLRSTCQPKTKATNEAIDGMHTGNWDIDHNAMCYMFCVMNMNKLFKKDNTFNYETGLSMSNQHLPEPRRTATIKTMDNCKDAVKTLDDKCVAGYELAKCFYLDNPENYFLP